MYFQFNLLTVPGKLGKQLLKVVVKHKPADGIKCAGNFVAFVCVCCTITGYTTCQCPPFSSKLTANFF